MKKDTFISWKKFYCCGNKASGRNYGMAKPASNASSLPKTFTRSVSEHALQLILLILLISGLKGWGQTTYYSKSGQTDPNNLSNWTSNSNGTGSNPANFTGDGLTFIIQTGHSYTTTAAWGITGASTLQVDGTLTLSHVLTNGTASTKVGNLTINGTVQANTQNVIANTSGAFTINNGGRYVMNNTTASNSSTVFNGVETFNSGSTFEYANLSASGFVSSITYHHLTISGNITQTFPATISINGDLNISAGTITMGKNQTVTGAINVSGGTLQITNNTNNFTLIATGGVNVTGGTFNMAVSSGTASITGNVTVSNTGTFNMTTNATAGAPTITGNVTVSGGSFYAAAASAGAVTATISGNLSVTGGTFYVTGNTALTSHILDLNGTLDLSNTGVIEFNPVAAASGAGRVYVSGNVTISGGTMQRTQTRTDGSTGIYFDGSTQTFTWSGGSISNAMPNRFYVNGVTTLNEVYSHSSSSQTTVNGTEGTAAVGSAWPTSINNLTINNTNGVTLSTAKTVAGTLTFTNGILTPNGNTLIVSNTATNAISGAGTGKYVSGPLRWNLSNTNGTYVYPVGKGGNYYPFSLTTTAASSPVITVESFNSDAGGTNGATITSPSTTEYWSATLNSGTFTGSISLTRPTSHSFDVIAQSSTQTGTYSSIGGTLSSPSVNNSNSISTLGFFKFASSAACSDPTTQASGVTFSSVTDAGMTINWSGSGNGDGVIVVMKAGSAPTDPSDNTSYSASTTFGSVTNIGSDGSYVVFNGSGSSVSVTGLSAATNYFVEVFSKNCTGTSTKINTTSPANSSSYTLSTEPGSHTTLSATASAGACYYSYLYCSKRNY